MGHKTSSKLTYVTNKANLGNFWPINVEKDIDYEIKAYKNTLKCCKYNKNYSIC